MHFNLKLKSFSLAFMAITAVPGSTAVLLLDKPRRRFTDTEIETDALSFYDRHHVGNHDQNASFEVPESLLGVDDSMTAVVTSTLLRNNDHNRSMDSRATTTNGSGSGDVQVDAGMLQTKRHLNSGGEDCNDCDSRPKIVVSGTNFEDLVSSCYPEYDDDPKICPDNVPIGCWDTSEVTDMNSAFYENSIFDDSINCWNTARVTTMANMFFEATNFNQPLDDWNVARVTDMRSMFLLATNFNQSLDDWNVASLTNMNGMFQQATTFNQPLDDWNVASVTDMEGMFYRATNFNQPLDDWNVASVTDMRYMFKYAAGFNQPLDDWNVVSVTKMASMFNKATNFNQPLDDWNVASVTSMKSMFFYANFNQCLSSWADKTPPDVYLYDTFSYSRCPDKNPVATVGPWCQGEDDEQCIAQSATDAPTEAPSDAPTEAPTEAPTTSPTKKSKKSKK